MERFLKTRRHVPAPNDNADGESRAAEALARRAVSILSPLRYPGGKRRLAGYVAAAIRLNGLRPKPNSSSSRSRAARAWRCNS